MMPASKKKSLVHVFVTDAGVVLMGDRRALVDGMLLVIS